MQEEVGLQVITDGEFRRRSWFQDFMLELNGASVKFLEGTFVDEGGHKLPTPTPHFDEKLHPGNGITTDAFEFIASNTSRTAKATIPSPNMAHVFGGRAAISETVYPHLDEFWQDLALIYRHELAELAKLGCRYVQIDDCAFTMLLDDNVRGRLKERGDDPEELLDTYIHALNLVLQDRPTDSLLRPIYVVATIADTGLPREAMTRSRRNYSTNSKLTRISWSMSRHVPVLLNRCDLCLAIRP